MQSLSDKLSSSGSISQHPRIQHQKLGSINSVNNLGKTGGGGFIRAGTMKEKNPVPVALPRQMTNVDFQSFINGQSIDSRSNNDLPTPAYTEVIQQNRGFGSRRFGSSGSFGNNEEGEPLGSKSSKN